jgi:hypothetical protein
MNITLRWGAHLMERPTNRLVLLRNEITIVRWAKVRLVRAVRVQMRVWMKVVYL